MTFRDRALSLVRGTKVGWGLAVAAAVAFVFVPRASSDAPVYSVMALGDSLGEGVQSADSSWRTQSNNFGTLVAKQMGVTFPEPLIQSWALGNIFSNVGRSRISPLQIPANIAVSGATVHDLLYDRRQSPYIDEVDLILSPSQATQIEIAEALKPAFSVVWIGSNDVDGAILSWDQLDASQLTPLADFTTDYTALINRMKAWNGKVVVGNILDVTKVSYLFGRQDLIDWLGKDFGLPEGSYVGAPTALLLKLGLDDGSLLQNPNYVLDPSELALIQQRVIQFNQVIQTQATGAGFAVADAYTMFENLRATPPVFFGKALTSKFLGGLLSLDQLHPSNIGHAFAANLFIDAANQKYNLQIPRIGPGQLAAIAALDPFVDWNGNGLVRGRPLAGFLETFGPAFGISGDSGDFPGAPAAAPQRGVFPQMGAAFMTKYLTEKGQVSTAGWTKRDAIAAVRDVFGSAR